MDFWLLLLYKGSQHTKQALSDQSCRLKTLKLSIGSLKLLDFESCNTLGSFLRRIGVKVVLSQTVNPSFIMDMFNVLDKDNSGFLDLAEFGVAYRAFQYQKIQHRMSGSPPQIISDLNNNTSIADGDGDEATTAIFQRLAIRRLNKRDRIYFADFWDSFISLDNKKFGGQSYDITEIDHPLHFIFQHLITCLYNSCDIGKHNSDLNKLIELPRTMDEWNQTVNSNLQAVFYFSIGLQYETQCLPLTQQNVLVSALLTLKEIDEIKKTNATIQDPANIIVRNGNDGDTEIDIMAICRMCQLFLVKAIKELLKLENIQSHDIMFKTSKLHVNTLSSHKKEKFVGDILDLCLCLEMYRFFVIVANSILVISHTNETKTMIANKVANYDGVILLEIVSEAIRNNLVATVELLLPMVSKNNEIERSIESATKLFFELIKVNVNESTHVNDRMIEIIHESFAANIDKNDNFYSKQMSDLIAYMVHSVCEGGITKLAYEREELRLAMIEENYIESGYETCNNIENNIKKYNLSLIKNGISTLASKHPTTVNDAITYLSGKEGTTANWLIDGDDAEHNVMVVEMLLDSLVKCYDAQLLCKNLLNDYQLWNRLLRNHSYEIFAYMMKHYIEHIDLDMIQERGGIHPVYAFFKVNDITVLYQKRLSVIEFVNVINDNVEMVARNAKKLGYDYGLAMFLKNNLQNPQFSDGLWDKVCLYSSCEIVLRMSLYIVM